MIFIPQRLVVEGKSFEQTYKPVLDFSGWKIAMLLELNVAYDIQQSIWHHVAMSSDTHILMVERSETSVETTDYAELSPELVSTVKARFTVKG